MINTPNLFSLGTQNDGEISLLDVVNFLTSAWKKLVIAALTGAFLGFVSWFVLGNYISEYTLINNTGGSTNSNVFSLVSWKTIQKSLPSLAGQMLENGKVPDGQNELYRILASEAWWQQNVVPGYVISKSDVKDLALSNKDLETLLTTVHSLTITASGKTNQDSIDNVRGTAKFLRSGGAYIQLRNILHALEVEIISASAEIQRKITSIEIEMGYQVQRAKALEALHKRFPGNGNMSGSLVDPKDSGAKYLPITTQMIAINGDIDRSKEDLQRLRDRQRQVSFIKTFFDEASPIADTTFDGFVLGAELLQIEARMRAGLPKGDIHLQVILDQLNAQILGVQTSFTRGLDGDMVPTSLGKKGLVKSVMVGLVATLSLVFLLLLGQRQWVIIKSTHVTK